MLMLQVYVQLAMCTIHSKKIKLCRDITCEEAPPQPKTKPITISPYHTPLHHLTLTQSVWVVGEEPWLRLVFFYLGGGKEKFFGLCFAQCAHSHKNTIARIFSARAQPCATRTNGPKNVT